MISQVCLIWLSWITCDVETSNLYHWTQDFYTAFEMEKYVFLWDVNTLFEKNYLHAQMQSFEICGMIFWRIYFFLFVLRNLLILYSANGWPASTKHLATKKIEVIFWFWSAKIVSQSCCLDIHILLWLSKFCMPLCRFNLVCHKVY